MGGANALASSCFSPTTAVRASDTVGADGVVAVSDDPCPSGTASTTRDGYWRRARAHPRVALHQAPPQRQRQPTTSSAVGAVSSSGNTVTCTPRRLLRPTLQQRIPARPSAQHGRSHRNPGVPIMEAIRPALCDWTMDASTSMPRIDVLRPDPAAVMKAIARTAARRPGGDIAGRASTLHLGALRARRRPPPREHPSRLSQGAQHNTDSVCRRSGQASHDVSDDALAVAAAANLVRAGS
jgi:hypothetical protein